MHEIDAKRWKADGDVLRSILTRRRILDPLAIPRDDRLSGVNIHRAVLARNAKCPSQYDRVFVEPGRLPRFNPAAWTLHTRDAEHLRARVHATDVLLDDFRLVA